MLTTGPTSQINDGRRADGARTRAAPEFMEREVGQYGLETMCVGGGQGMAMVLERL